MKYFTPPINRIRLRYTLLAIFTLGLIFSSSSWAADFQLAWDASSDPDVVGYRLYYQTNSAALPFTGDDALEGPSPLDLGTDTFATISGLADDGIHYFTVTAYTADGRESSYSNIVASDWVPVPESPGQNSSNIDLNPSFHWTAPPDGRSVVYTVYVGTDPSLDQNLYFAKTLPVSGGLPVVLAGMFFWGWRKKSAIGTRTIPYGRFALILVAVCLLPACGGGGGGGSDSSTTMTSEQALAPSNPTTDIYTLVYDDLVDNVLQVENLDPDTRYYWKIVAWDGETETESVIYSFKTIN